MMTHSEVPRTRGGPPIGVDDDIGARVAAHGIGETAQKAQEDACVGKLADGAGGLCRGCSWRFVCIGVWV